MWNLHFQLSSVWLTPVLVCLVVVGLPKIYQIIVNVQRNHRLEAELVSRHGCKDPVRLYYKWPLALDLILEVFKADQAGAILGFFVSIIERTGTTFEQILLGSRGIDTVDPKNLEAVLSTQFNEFGLGARSDNFRALLGHGIFTQDGAPWKASRDLLKPQFMETRSKAFADIQEEVERFVRKVKALSTGVLDLQPLFFRLTLDTTMAVLFGRSLDSSEVRGRGDETAFAKAFDYAQHQLARRGRLGDLYWLLGGKEFRRSCKAVHSFVDNIVADALEESQFEAPGEGSAERYVFLKALISKTRDPIVLRDQLVNVLLAGRDTTACLLSWTVTLLARHQDVQYRLRSECLNLASFKAGDLPTLVEVEGMRYMKNVLDEVLRLYPSVPVNSRSALKTTTLPVGGGPDGLSPILVRKGEAVGYCPFVMHRRKDIYGEDAAAFRPSRWDPDTKEGPNLRGIGWAYLPFNGGPRICPGQKFALLEASCTVTRLLQTFQHIELAEGSPVQERQSLTLVVSNANGCKVLLRQ